MARVASMGNTASSRCIRYIYGPWTSKCFNHSWQHGLQTAKTPYVWVMFAVFSGVENHYSKQKTQKKRYFLPLWPCDSDATLVSGKTEQAWPQCNGWNERCPPPGGRVGFRNLGRRYCKSYVRTHLHLSVFMFLWVFFRRWKSGRARFGDGNRRAVLTTFNLMRHEKKACFRRGGQEQGRHLWWRLVQQTAERTTSHELSCKQNLTNQFRRMVCYDTTCERCTWSIVRVVTSRPLQGK